MSNFQFFASAIAANFVRMSQGELFHVNVSGDDVWAAYLAAFPEGTNPIYRVRTEHDGSYDRNFVRKLGNVVAINPNGTLLSIWRGSFDAPYNEVAAKLAQIVETAAIEGLFRTKERTLGYVSTIERRAGFDTHRWYHFHADIDRKHITSSVGEAQGEAATTVQVMRRGFEEITVDAVQTVLDLIDDGGLYRGDEFRASLAQFKMAQDVYLRTQDEHSRSVLLWGNYRAPCSRLRNTVIGTLLTDLSEGVDIERAVKAYEVKVAPTNYKRPTALITKGMIEQATKTIRDLGLESALERRFAVIGDLSVNNVLWVDNQVQPLMRDGLKDLLMGSVAPSKPNGASAEPIAIEDFMWDVLPHAVALELFFANPHQSNLMSLTAPAHDEAGSLFKWGNNFAWSYNGNITDSIKEKVKAAGGNTDAALRVSLAWFNLDDLDLHCFGPEGHVFFGYKAGILDVDMNAMRGTTRSPVENLSWINPRDGQYQIVIDQYCRRETSDVGFTLEVENGGKVTQYSYPKAVSGNTMALVFTVKNQKIVELKAINKGITGQGIAQQKWGLSTENFVKVNTVLHSPNHWDGERTGNKHWFFILDNCQNDEPARGIYNEFLKPELETHRKVFEVLGNKTKCLPTSEQLSGLGFSSTKRDSVTAKVTGQNSTKLYNITF